MLPKNILKFSIWALRTIKIETILTISSVYYNRSFPQNLNHWLWCGRHSAHAKAWDLVLWKCPRPSTTLRSRLLRPPQTRAHCCWHKVAHDVSWAAQTEKHLLRTQNVSEQNQKHFLCPGHKICVRNKCCPCRQTGKHLCQQQCVCTNVSSFARAFRLPPKG